MMLRTAERCKQNFFSKINLILFLLRSHRPHVICLHKHTVVDRLIIDCARDIDHNMH
jgi:hypothetical protein